MQQLILLEKYLIDPSFRKKLKYFKFENKKDYFETSDKHKFFIENGIPNFFVNEKNEKVTNLQKDFYNEIKFPNYDNIEDFGTLIDKAKKSIYAYKLDNEIPMNSYILEAGCGTGQLSIFLSRYNRKVFGIDRARGSRVRELREFAVRISDFCNIPINDETEVLCATSFIYSVGSNGKSLT